MRQPRAAPDYIMQPRRPLSRRGFDGIGEALQRSEGTRDAVVGDGADARIEQHLQAGFSSQLDDVHVTPPR
ncbi:hypothetical protein [Trinickia dinghuensis]|uniref:hypothetical protein n=1 Tax=Trinickia dinghuensis TaxID=2291023 RepID=UPI0015F17545|nr:hypothetical protein [Trinickia dinghuensis]